MKKECHIFNLEDILINFERKIWVIDKENPTVPLMKIKESDYNLIISNIFRNQGYKISYNGNKMFLPKFIFEKLDIPLDRVGLSLREFIDKEYIDYSKLNINLKLFKHLRNKYVSIILLTNKLLENNIEKLSEHINDYLNQLGLELEKIYFTNKNLRVSDKDYMNKTNIIIKYLSSYKVNNDENKLIEDDDIEKFSKVYYYDSDSYMIEQLKDINNTINTYIGNSDESIKNDIKHIESVKLFISLITTNELNIFKSFRVPITVEVSVNENIYLKRFSNF